MLFWILLLCNNFCEENPFFLIQTLRVLSIRFAQILATDYQALKRLQIAEGAGNFRLQIWTEQNFPTSIRQFEFEELFRHVPARASAFTRMQIGFA